jgi:hypothetical protein
MGKRCGSHRKKMRGKMGKGVYFDGCHRNNQELTGIVSPSKEKNLSAPSSNPTFSLPSHAFLRDTTSNNYNEVPSTSFN